MDWDQTLEKLRREAFRPTIPPPVRLPAWATAALVGAGLTLAGPACDRGAGDGQRVSDMGRVNVEYGAPMPPDMGETPPPPMETEPLYAAPPPADVRSVEPPPPVEEYGAPIMRVPAPPPPQMDEAMTPLTPAAPRDAIGEARPMYGIPPHLRPEVQPMPPPGQKMYGAPRIDTDDE